MTKFTSCLLIICSVLGVLCADPPRVSAKIVINEVMPAPSIGDEWIELKNTGTESATLANWQIDDNTGALTTVPALQTLTLQPGVLAVLEVKNRLNNSGDHLLLKQLDGTQSDYLEYLSSLPDLSWSRDSSGNILQTLPTKGQENIFPSPSPAPTPQPSVTPMPTPSPSPVPSPIITPWPSPYQTSPLPSPTASPVATFPLQLSEIMACPQTNEPEWVEFFNPNGTAVTLTNWKFHDNSSNSRVFSITIPAQGFSAADLSSSMLNNDGDVLTVLDPSGNPVSTQELPGCEKGESFVYVQGSWQLTNQPTKNMMNQFVFTGESNDQPTDTPSIDRQPFSSESFPSTNSAAYEHFPASYPLASPLAISEVNLSDTSTDSASPSGQVLGASDSAYPNYSPTQEASPQIASVPLPFFFTKPFLIGLFLCSAVATCVGGFGLQQWYTERHVETVLEDF